MPLILSGSFLSMEWVQILQAVLALMFVIGLLLLTLWLLKYCQQKGLKCRLLKNHKTDSRIEVMEIRRLDAKNTIFIVRCDQSEYSLLLGANNNLLLSVTKVENHD